MKYKIIIPKEELTRKIDTCYNFNKEIGCVQTNCRCEKEEPKQEQDKKLYSEEEVRNLFIERCKEFSTKMKPFQTLLLKQDLEWFEKNKKI